ncbi:MAG: radical SAM protein [Desulfobulbus sp.]|nr:radical SAM protein [Desulfobulbus sp.]
MTQITKSGIFVREESQLGLLTYSPFSGLFYACNVEDKYNLLKWLDKQSTFAPSSDYEKALGAGWFIDSTSAVYPVPHLLPPQFAGWKKGVLCAQMPIVINWLLTGNCSLKCKYCYAQDVMNGSYKEPSYDDINVIAESIIKQNPLVVVLTGGDPLMSKHLEYAISLLHEKAGIIIDTNGYLLNDNHIEIFKKYNVFVRVSIDSEIIKINNSLRPLINKKNIDSKCPTTSAFNAIIKCINNEIKISVQSVATKKNRSDFISFGNKLYDIGVDGWRILMVAPSKHNFKNYLDLKGDDIGIKRFKSHILNEIRERHSKIWNSKMSIQVAENNIPNAVVLVAPDGTFLTESNIRNNDCIGKIVIDNESPKNPRKEFFSISINMHAHTERYLNL